MAIHPTFNWMIKHSSTLTIPFLVIQESNLIFFIKFSSSSLLLLYFFF
jgi:hypothetical protein